jgi:hypothetical protein
MTRKPPRGRSHYQSKEKANNKADSRHIISCSSYSVVTNGILKSSHTKDPTGIIIIIIIIIKLVGSRKKRHDRHDD